MRNPKRNVACLVLFLFLSSFTLHGAIGATSDQIVINEFDLNPPGNDNYGSVEEWVELYNPTSEAVNIGGWTFSTTSGETVSVTIPGGTMIAARAFPPELMGAAFSVRMTGFRMGSIVGPLLGGYMYIALSPKSPFTAAGLLFLVGIPIVLFIKEKQNRHT